MLKVLIILLLVFSVLSLNFTEIKKYLKKALFINVNLIIVMIISIFGGYNIILNNNLYLACKYEAQLAQYASYAQNAMRDTGAYASLILAQVIVESGFGAHKSTFGEKIPGINCATESDVCAARGGQCLTTSEEYGGQKVTIKACFKMNSGGLGDTIYEHGNFLTKKFGNRQAFNSATSLQEQLMSLKSNPKAQYATSSVYLCSLIDQINACDLTKYDAGISGGIHLGTISKEHCSDNIVNEVEEAENSYVEPAVADPLNPFEEVVEKDHFATEYGGVSTDGWLYIRTRAYEDPKDEIYSDPDIMDDSIDEIFYRARLTYTEALDAGYADMNEEGDMMELEGDNEKLCEDVKSVDSGGVSTWRQSGKPWSKIKLGTGSDSSISAVGCFTTALAIQIERSGVETGIENFNPGTFACEMLKRGGYTADANIYASKVDFIPGVSSTLNESFSATQGSNASLANRLRVLQQDGHYPILWVNGSGSSGHYVAVTGVSNDNISIIDPAGRGDKLWPTYSKVSAIRSVKVH